MTTLPATLTPTLTRDVTSPAGDSLTIRDIRLYRVIQGRQVGDRSYDYTDPTTLGVIAVDETEARAASARCSLRAAALAFPGQELLATVRVGRVLVMPEGDATFYDYRQARGWTDPGVERPGAEAQALITHAA